MRNLFVVLASLCLVSALALGASLFWPWHASAPPGPLHPVTTDSAGGPTQERPATDADGSASAATGEAAEDEGEDAGVAEDDDLLRQDANGPSNQEGPWITVVRSQPGLGAVPVADATVRFVTTADGRRLLPNHEQLHPSAWPERIGQSLTTDSQGVVQLPRSRQGWLVSACSGDEFAFASVPANRRNARLELQLDERIVVVVTRPDGTAAPDLPVALSCSVGNRAITLWRTQTDARGRAEVSHFQVLRPDAPRENSRDFGDGRGEEAFAALLCLPHDEPIAAAFLGRPAQTEAVALVAPWLATVEVLLTDHGGTPLLSSARLWLSANVQAREASSPGRPGIVLPGSGRQPRGPASSGSTSSNGSLPVPRQETVLAATKEPGRQPARFENVPIGASLRAGAQYRHERRGPRVDFAGPTVADAALRIELPAPANRAVAAGRILLRTGEGDVPVASADVTLVFWRADGNLGSVQVETIADGQFDLVTSPRENSGQDWIEFRYGNPAGAPVTDPPLATPEMVFGKRLPMPTLRAGERCELGEILLQPLPPLARGQVVDDLGQPIAEAVVQLQAQFVKGNRQTWRNVPGPSTRSDDAGAFALFGERPLGQLQLAASADEHFPAKSALLAADAPTRIVLERHGILFGRVLLPGWVGDGMLELLLVPQDPALDEGTRRQRTKRTALSRSIGGRFSVRPLHPGPYAATVRMRNLPDPVFELPSLYIAPGANRPGQLALLDLRLAIYRYRLQAVGADGQRLGIDTPLLARFQRSDGTQDTAGFRFQKGRAEVLTVQPMLEFIAFAPGCAPTAITLPPGDHTVMLQEQTPARVTLPGAYALCGDQRLVRVSTILTSATGFPESLSGQDQRSGQRFSFPRWAMGKSSGAWLENGDTVHVPLAQSGEYEIVLRVHATKSARSPQASVPLGTHMLRVNDVGTTVRVPIDTEKVLAALAEVDARQRAAEEMERQAQQQRQNGPAGRPR